MYSNIQYLMYCLVILLFVGVNAKNTGAHELHRSVSWLKKSVANESIAKGFEDLQNSLVNVAELTHSPLSHEATDYMSDTGHVVQQELESDKEKESTGDVVFNVHHFTQFLYGDDQVYIYSPKKNDEHVQEPQRLAFYYVPVLQPLKVSSDSQWVWVHKNEVRVRLALGTPDVEKAARKAIADQYDNEIVDRYSKLWVVAPLMINSLSAYIVTGSSSVIEGVAPFHIDNPVSNAISFRFTCVTNQIAQDIASSLLDGDYDIEVSFYFAGMHTVRTNMITITASQLQSVLSKTIADGEGTNATYIHRDQASNFLAKYVTNVKKMIYIEDPSANMTLLTNGLEEQFTAQFQEGIDNSKEVQIQADVFGQVWQSTDLNPDRITSEMNKMFTYNQSETQRHNDRMNYYNVNQRKDSSLSIHTALDVRVRLLFERQIVIYKPVSDKKDSEEYVQTNHETVSEVDIKKAASQASMEVTWEGEKFIPKSFKVFKLTDAVNHLQVAIISKQLLAEKANGAVIRKVGALTSSVGSMNVLTGEIKLYAGVSPPSHPWLICDGSIVSRSKYARLFSVIGTQYGESNDAATFRLPDLRGRVPIGIDNEQLRMENVAEVGATGGSAKHTLAIEELPAHVHDQGTLRNSNDGVHTHGIHDPGHNHGGQTGNYPVSSSTTDNYGSYYSENSGQREWQAYSISSDFTQISLSPNGNHTHQLTGHTGMVGQSKSFSILPPFQAFQYIIYAGDCF